jgi:hypothetical protein
VRDNYVAGGGRGRPSTPPVLRDRLWSSKCHTQFIAAHRLCRGRLGRDSLLCSVMVRSGETSELRTALMNGHWAHGSQVTIRKRMQAGDVCITMMPTAGNDGERRRPRRLLLQLAPGWHGKRESLASVLLHKTDRYYARGSVPNTSVCVCVCVCACAQCVCVVRSTSQPRTTKADDR